MLRTRLVLLCVLLVALSSCGGENVISGFGNSGNVFGTDTTEKLVKALAESPAIPAVSDDDLVTAWNAIRDKARSGDMDATFVVLRVAAEQRKKKE